MRKIEKLSPKHSKAKKLFENSDKSIREIAKLVDANEKSVRNWIQAGGWQRKSAAVPQPESLAEVTERVLERGSAPDQPSETEERPSRSASAIAQDFCGTLDVLRAEIDAVVRNLHLVREIVDSNLDEEEASDTRRKLVNKVLELPGLVAASERLTAALARVADAGPGKKEQAKQQAKATGTGRFATPAPPRGMPETLQ